MILSGKHQLKTVETYDWSRLRVQALLLVRFH